MFSKPEFQHHSTVDKRGRKVEKRKNDENMRKYYKLRDEVGVTLVSKPRSHKLLSLVAE